MTAKRQGGVQCIAKTIRILEFIAQKDKVGSTEIARELEMHVATVHNILCELTNNHYLVNINGQYGIGPGVCSLISHYNPNTALADIIKPYLIDMVQKTTETASATVMVGDSAHLIGFEQSQNSIGVVYPKWIWDDPLQLGTATLLISMTFTPERKDALYKKLKLSKKDIQANEAIMQRVSTQGYYVKPDAGDGELYAITAAVYTRNNTPVASIGISIPKFRADKEILTKNLRVVIETAIEASKALGANEPMSYIDLDNLSQNIPENKT